MAEDIRTKTQSSIDIRIREGKFVAPRAPYGYKKSLNDCHILIIDAGADSVAKEIFNMAYNKVGLNEIARRLNASSILTPINYARANGLQGNYEQGNGHWNTRTIKYILTNRIYAGDLEQGKEKIVVQNTHEAIVSRDMFDAVQRLLKSQSDKLNTATNTSCPDNILKSKVICSSCGSKMQHRKGSGKFKWYFFTCISKNRLGEGHCKGMYIRESEIMDVISSEIKQYVSEKEIKSFAVSDQIEKLKVKIAHLNDCFQAHQEKYRSQYEAHIQGSVAVQDLKLASEAGERLRSEIESAESNIEILGKEQKQYNLFHSALHDKSYMDELIGTYLQKATVHNDRRVDVSFHP